MHEQVDMYAVLCCALSIFICRSAELRTQVPKPEVQFVDKHVPKIVTEHREHIVEVPSGDILDFSGILSNYLTIGSTHGDKGEGCM